MKGVLEGVLKGVLEDDQWVFCDIAHWVPNFCYPSINSAW